MTAPPDRSAGTLLRDAWQALRADWLLAIPLVILGALSGGDGDRNDRPMASADFDASPEAWLAWLPFFALLGLLALALLVVLFFVYVAVWMMTTHAALAMARGEARPGWGAAWAAIKPRLGAGAGASILAILAAIAGFILLIVPGFIVVSALFPLMAVIVAEGLGGSGALRRTWDLTRGERMPLFLVLLAGIGVNILAAILFGWIPFLGDVLAGAVSGFVSAGFAVAAALWYRRKTSAPPPAPPVVVATP